MTATATSPITDTPTAGPSLLDRKRNQFAASAKPAQALPHKEIIGAIETYLTPIDYRAAAGLGPDGKVSDDNYVLCTIERTLAQLESKGLMLGKINKAIYLFNGAYFKELDADEIRGIIKRAAEALGMPHNKAALVKFINEAHLQLLDSAPIIDTTPPKDVVKINALNGTVVIDIKTGAISLDPFSAADAMRYQLTYAYNERATCPTWDAVLASALPDADVRKVVAEWQGYVFLPSSVLPLEKVMLFHGGGSNGKGVVYEVVKAMYGKDNVCENSLEHLTTKETHRVMLADKLLNFGSDINTKVEPAAFKTLASGEPIVARRLYGQPFMLGDYAKMQFSCNTKPQMSDYSHGFRRRFIHVDFKVKVTEEMTDPGLKSRIVATELPGILNWAIDGLRRLLKQGNFTRSQVIEDSARAYHESGDVILRFLNEPGEGYQADHTHQQRAVGKDMFEAFQTFCTSWRHDKGGQNVSAHAFYIRLEELGFVRGKKGAQGVVFYAIQRPFEN